jgi:hypothetical protein
MTSVDAVTFHHEVSSINVIIADNIVTNDADGRGIARFASVTTDRNVVYFAFAVLAAGRGAAGRRSIAPDIDVWDRARAT